MPDGDPIAVAGEIAAHYMEGEEQRRLSGSGVPLELVRTQEILLRFLPPPPAALLDVGGGPGAYAFWLAELGYTVHLVDPVPLHLEQARATERERGALAGISQGDARRLELADYSADAVLLLGPLYHLTERSERLLALREAHRVLRPGGLLFAAAISRFASALDGLARGFLRDPEFHQIVERDLLDGQHRNPGNQSGYFTTAFLHHPNELRAEITEAGFELDALLAVEGPAWLIAKLDRFWEDADHREVLLGVLRALEAEPSLLGASAHLIAAGRKAHR
jgi:SAM-dependent methyltransferase